ncbi:MAG: Oxidoreductase molybdopterin binding domain protein [Chlorobi bacterium OLB7]|nr:MAG: Oxidoreductase molybdopterin binding domain protein [Chlorobi bacterium OLB7]
MDDARHQARGVEVGDWAAVRGNVLQQPHHHLCRFDAGKGRRGGDHLPEDDAVHFGKPAAGVGNRLHRQRYWTGIPLKHFLDKAGIDYNLNRRILLYGADKPSDGSRQFGFINNLTVDRIINGESQGLFPPILAYAMNGEPLTREHGFPVRLIVHEMYGFSNVKWLVRASATQAPQDTGTYQLEGYTERVIQASSRGTSVREGVSIPRGETVIRGFAISGHAAISTVEISIDGGPFAPATITPLAEIQDQESLPPSIQQLSKGTAYPYQGVWTPWTFRWDAPGGTHTIAIRATDAAGNTQPDPDDSISDGQNGVVKYKVTVS